MKAAAAVRRVYEIVEDGNYSRSSSAKTVELRLEMEEIFGSLAPCQLPEFLAHGDKSVRYYAEKRRRECLQVPA